MTENHLSYLIMFLFRYQIHVFHFLGSISLPVWMAVCGLDQTLCLRLKEKATISLILTWVTQLMLWDTGKN